MPLLPGKLPVRLLQQLLRFRGAPDRRVVLGPAFGQDAAVIDLGQQYLILKSDPVTFTTEDIGWYAVHVMTTPISIHTVARLLRRFGHTCLTAASASEAIGLIHIESPYLGVTDLG